MIVTFIEETFDEYTGHDTETPVAVQVKVVPRIGETIEITQSSWFTVTNVVHKAWGLESTVKVYGVSADTELRIKQAKEGPA